MPYLFKAKTTEGYTIKILAELLQHNLKTACFVIEPTGISLRQMDSHRHVLIDIHLNPKILITEFNIQKYNPGGHFKKWHWERETLAHAHRIFAWMTYLNDVEEG